MPGHCRVFLCWLGLILSWRLRIQVLDGAVSLLCAVWGSGCVWGSVLGGLIPSWRLCGAGFRLWMGLRISCVQFWVQCGAVCCLQLLSRCVPVLEVLQCWLGQCPGPGLPSVLGQLSSVQCLLPWLSPSPPGPQGSLSAHVPAQGQPCPYGNVLEPTWACFCGREQARALPGFGRAAAGPRGVLDVGVELHGALCLIGTV